MVQYVYTQCTSINSTPTPVYQKHITEYSYTRRDNRMLSNGSHILRYTVRTIISAPPLQNAVSHTTAERMQLLLCRSPIARV
jgi:hypothetical protein